MAPSAAAARVFIETWTMIAEPPLLPGIRLHLATEITPIWHATEALLAETNIPPPFWAFPWAGGQALARYVLDRPALVAGKRILDFGAGSGLVGIAAAKAGAESVLAADIDPVACLVIGLNAALNDVAIETTDRDVIDAPVGADIVLVGDMCYERPLAERLTAWLRLEAARGILVLLGDPGRTYRPAEGLEERARYTVPTSLELEDRETREGVVWRLLPG